MCTGSTWAYLCMAVMEFGSKSNQSERGACAVFCDTYTKNCTNPFGFIASLLNECKEVWQIDLAVAVVAAFQDLLGCLTGRTFTSGLESLSGVPYLKDNLSYDFHFIREPLVM